MERYESWIDRAKSSYGIAIMPNSLGIHIYYEDLCYQLQQSVEKALKGLLIYYGAEPEFTHNIEILFTDIEKYIEIPINIKQSMKLTIYAVQTRYPGEYDDVTKEEYEKSIKTAKECIDWVEKTIEENKKKNDKE
jgi:HEPN domain-containing protein